MQICRDVDARFDACIATIIDALDRHFNDTKLDYLKLYLLQI
jgi:hypothetical protein